jgi:hypothetical protein
LARNFDCNAANRLFSAVGSAPWPNIFAKVRIGASLLFCLITGMAEVSNSFPQGSFGTGNTIP